MPPIPTLSPLKTATRALLEAVGDLDTAASDATNPSFKAALDLSTKRWAAVQDLAKGSSTASIVDFFNAIGSGVIDAQKKLDEASERYIRGALQQDSPGAGTLPRGAGAGALSGSPPVMGAMFRIPRVTAELKCSLETDHEKKFNVILYSERNDVRDFHQQTVQLEVVSVPVPPDYLNYLAAHPAVPAGDSGKAPVAFSEPGRDGQTADPGTSAQTPGPVIFSEPGDDSSGAPNTGSLPPAADAPAAGESAAWLQTYLVDETAREQVRTLIEKLDAKQSGERSSVVRRLLLPAWSRALVLTDGNNARFVLLAERAKPGHLLLWQVVLRPASVQLLGKLSAKRLSGPDLTRLHRLLERLGDSQAAAQRLR